MEQEINEMDLETLLRPSNPNDGGFFILCKSVFMEERWDTAGRCGLLTYTGQFVTEGTPYDYQSHGTSIKPEDSLTDTVDYLLPLNEIARFEEPICVHPHFTVQFLQMSIWRDIQKEPNPSAMWAARSMYQLFKNIREWSFMVDEPFSSDHPMAIYSKIALDVLSPEKSILDEIDAMPDSHLAMFLKGNPDYKKIPDYAPPSENMKNWIAYLAETYPNKNTASVILGN